jgi:hypothetical protein
MSSPKASNDQSPVSIDAVSFAFNLERQPGHGQDADPIIYVTQQEVTLAVFDGMGGAGSEVYQTADGQQSGAYLAATLAARVTKEWFEGQSSVSLGARAEPLKQVYLDALQRKCAELPKSVSRLRSRMIRTLPTTAAIMSVSILDEQTYACDAIWAGDSRAFIVTPAEGLLQLTNDHLQSREDAFTNLTQDAAVENCISADADFFLEERFVESIRGPLIALVGSDGCFGYLPTPIMFEHRLLATLLKATTHEEWKELLKGEFGQAAGDDASLAISAIGWPCFESLQNDFRQRFRKLLDTYVTPITDAHHRVEQMKSTLDEAERQLDALLLETWNTYRRTYEARMPSRKYD